MRLELEETGYIEVSLGEVKASLDLYAVNNRLVTIRNAAEGDAEKRNDETVAYMATLGFPTVSHKTAIAFTNGIIEAVKELEKKDQPSAESTPPT